MEYTSEEFDTESPSNVSKIAYLSTLEALTRLSNSFRVIVLPLFVLSIGSDEAFYGLMVAMAGYVQSAVLFPAGAFSDKKGRGVAILFGGLFSGFILFLLPFTPDNFTLLILFSLTGIGAGFRMSSVRALIADATKRGNERTRSYGYTMAIATLAAVAGPFIGGYILDENALPGINPVMVRYAILFFMMGGITSAAGIVGFLTDRWLRTHNMLDVKEPVELMIDESQGVKDDARTATLFGITQLIMGFSSGMVVPYMVLWIQDAFSPDPFMLGSIPAISNITLATGALFVGLVSERIGKLKMITGLYLLAPLLTIGMVYSPMFIFMAVFYIARMAVANMAQPANNSLFMGEISQRRRGKSFAITRIMWTFPRQTGTLFTAFILTLGWFSGMKEFGVVVFPIAMILYPLSVIPMYLAVRKNSDLRQLEAIGNS